MSDAHRPPPSPSLETALSAGQTGLWLLHQLEPLGATYNLAYALELRGALDIDALARAVAAIVNRHDALRTTFSRDAEGGCRVRIAAPEELALPVVRLDDEPASTRDAAFSNVLGELAETPMELGRGPLFRAVLVRLEAARHVLIYAVHHLVFDGTSAWVFQRELSDGYRAFRTGGESQSAPPPPQFQEFVRAERAALSEERLAELLDFWRGALTGSPDGLALPGRPRRDRRQPRRGRSRSFELEPALTAALGESSRDLRVSLFVLLLAAFDTLLMRWCEQTDLVVGVPFQGRTLPESEGVIGYFANPLPVRADLSGDPRFNELVAGLNLTVFDALEHQDLPFSRLVEALAPARARGTNPLFEVSFQVLHDDSGVVGTGPGWGLPGLECWQRRLDSGAVPLDLVVTVRQRPGHAEVHVAYSVERFEAATVDGLFEDYRVLLDGIVANPDRRLSAYALPNEAARGRSIVGSTRSRPARAPTASLADRYEAQATRAPDAIAVRLGADSMSYRELDRAANGLAHYLRRKGVGRGAPVGVLMERSPALIVALLGIWKAGGAYVPIDPLSPDERLRRLLVGAGVGVAVTDGDRLEGLDVPELAVVQVGAGAGDAEQPADHPPLRETTPESLACVMFTSGSTGRPKGVEVPHRAIAHLLLDVDYVPLEAGLTTLHLAPLAFDASTFEIWGPLLHGGSLVLYPPGALDLAVLQQAVEEGGVSCLFLTTTLFNTIIDERPQALSRLSHLLTGGEVASLDHVRRARTLLPETRLVHVYGPTEGTTFATYWPVTEPIPDDARTIPIGRPIGDTRVYVLNPQARPVPVGSPGELVIGGPGVALGYRGRPAKTRERFEPDPFAEQAEARMYRTGDRARCLSDGNIDFLGRVDGQIKLRGFRVELGEIEAALVGHPAVAQGAAAAVGEGADKRLVAYVVLASPSASTTTLRQHLEARLPSYMLPSRILPLASLPLRPNGKVDRDALPAPGPDLDGGAVAPGSAWESALVELWQSVLGVEPIGVTDNFFELGGNSLQAVRLVSEIEWRWGWSPPVGALLEAPTISQLARLTPRDSSPGDAIVTLQPEGDGTPLFFVGGADGYSFTIRQLAQLLGNERPVLGVHYLGAVESQPKRARVEDIAGQIVSEIRGVRPQGPYLVAGYSFGCAAALEAARRLRDDGDEVSLVVLLEPSPLNSSAVERFSKPIKTLAGALGDRGLRGLAAQVRWGLSHRARTVVRRARRRIGQIQEKSPIQREVQRSYRTGQRALDKYAPDGYAGSVAVFYVPGRPADGLSRWVERVCPTVWTYEIPGNHHSALEPPNVYTLAERMRGCLAELVA